MGTENISMTKYRQKILFGGSVLIALFLVFIFSFPSLGCEVLFVPAHVGASSCIKGIVTWKHALQRTIAPKANTMEIGDELLSIEIANTPSKITKGLGERDSLGSNGMLFVMPSRGIPTFWMKGMRFDLDFVWIDGEKVVDASQHVKAEPGVPDSALRLYAPIYPVTHVLEMNAGEINKRGIQVGDTVRF